MRGSYFKRSAYDKSRESKNLEFTNYHGKSIERPIIDLSYRCKKIINNVL